MWVRSVLLLGVIAVAFVASLLILSMQSSAQSSVSAVGSLIVASTALVIAIWSEFLKRLILHPSLEFRFDPKSDVSKTEMVRIDERNGRQFVVFRSDCFYVHVRIHNSGNQAAEKVEVFIEELLQKQADGKFEKVSDFYQPLNLRWAYIHEVPGLAPGMYYPQITPKAEKALDIVHVLYPSSRTQFDEGKDSLDATKTALAFELVWKSSRRDWIREPGTYRCVLVAAAANALPVRKAIEIELTGAWDADEAEMRNKGLRVKLVNEANVARRVESMLSKLKKVGSRIAKYVKSAANVRAN